MEFDFSLASRMPEKKGTRWPTFDGEHWNGGSSLKLKEAGQHTLQYFSKYEGKCNFRVVLRDGTLQDFCG